MLSYGVWHDSWNPSCGISEMVSFAGSDFDDMQNCCQFWKTKEMELFRLVPLFLCGRYCGMRNALEQ